MTAAGAGAGAGAGLDGDWRRAEARPVAARWAAPAALAGSRCTAPPPNLAPPSGRWPSQPASCSPRKPAQTGVRWPPDQDAEADASGSPAGQLITDHTIQPFLKYTSEGALIENIALTIDLKYEKRVFKTLFILIFRNSKVQNTRSNQVLGHCFWRRCKNAIMGQTGTVRKAIRMKRFASRGLFSML